MSLYSQVQYTMKLDTGALMMSSVTLLTILTYATATDFSFIINTNFDDKNNWKDHIVPCWRDTINFGKDPVATLLPEGSFGLKEINFPDEAEMFFGEDSILLPGSQMQDVYNKCKKAREVKFVAGQKVANYHNFNNWYRATQDISLQPLLHAEMIPSQHDTASFLSQESYKVTIDVPVRVGCLNVSGYSHNSDTFEAYINSPEGELQFHVPESDDPFTLFETVEVTSGTCTASKGCINSNLLDKRVLRNICKQSEYDTDTVCSKPIQPEGHCSSFCGGRLVFEAQSVAYSEMKNNLLHYAWQVNNLDPPAPTSAQLGVSFALIKELRNDIDRYQIVFGPRNQSDKYSPELVDKFFEQIDAQISELVQSPSIIVRERSGTLVVVDLWILAVSLLMLCLVILGIVYAIFVKRHRSWTWFLTGMPESRMAWWRQGEDQVELELAEPASEESEDEEDTRKDNLKEHLEHSSPTAGSSSKPLAVVKPSGRIPSEKLLLQFENPSYQDLLTSSGKDQEMEKEPDAFQHLRTGEPGLPVSDNNSELFYSNPSYPDVTNEDL